MNDTRKRAPGFTDRAPSMKACMSRLTSGMAKPPTMPMVPDLVARPATMPVRKDGSWM